jgi:hypothetical protein
VTENKPNAVRASISVGYFHNETSFGLNDLEALVSVAREAKEWILRSCLEALSRFKGKLPALRGLPFAIDRNFQWRL